MNIYFFGDSISFGQYISVDYTWVTKIAMSLHKEFDGENITAINASVNGNTTRMALERMPYDIQSNKVDILVVGFGMNDCNYWKTDSGVPRVSPMAFEANLKEIVCRAFTFNVKKVILRTNHPSPRQDIMTNTNITYSQSNEYYNSIIRKVAEEDNSIVFADMERVCMDYCKSQKCSISEIVMPDNIHLSLIGHEIYYNTMYPIIKKCVKEISRG